jgi:alpha-L-fucosidase
MGFAARKAAAVVGPIASGDEPIVPITPTDGPMPTPGEGPFAATLDSLAGYKCPDWFRDAKLGIWNCWGPESQPEMGDWYARHMYEQGHPSYEQHLKTYGHPSKVGYKDLIPLWRGENWQPERLMKLYKKTGAKYFCAIAQHHDNFDCWNSKWHGWNSVKMGAKRDVLAEWGRVARAEGLRYGVTEHLGASWNWFGLSHTADKTGPLAGVPYDGADPRWASLYHTGDAKSEWGSWYNGVPERFQREWLLRIADLIDSQQPDLLYSDGSLPFGAYGRTMLARYYNNSARKHGGTVDNVYFCKNNPLDGGQYRDGFCVRDIERGIADGILPQPYQTDTCIGDWYYKKDIVYKTPTTVVQMLLDIVSKNGCLLLSVPLRGDGTLDSREEAILASLGTWMQRNGEAVYGTRPWRTFGEGKSGPAAGNFNEDKLAYTAEDIRFVTRGKDLYAFALAWPTTGVLRIRSLGESAVTGVHMVDGGERLKWTREGGALVVTLPAQQRGEHAFGLRVSGVVS